MPLLKVVHLLQKMNKKVICTLIKIIYDVKKILRNLKFQKF